MAKRTLTYSADTHEAIRLLAALIKSARLERGMRTQELAERANISRGLLYRIENADPACSIATVFEVASLLRIKLFDSNHDDLIFKNKMLEDKLTLLPHRIRQKEVKIDDNF